MTDSEDDIPLEDVLAFEQRWRRFTPVFINKECCVGRVWNNGTGDQCSRRPAPGSDLCPAHSRSWQTHGRVDGPIPEKKLLEFERAARGTSKSAPPPKAELKDSTHDAEASGSGQQKRRKDSPDPADASGGKSRCPSADFGHGGATKAQSSKPAGVPKEPKAKAKKAAKRNTGPRCTCGCPIHTERCRLFNPSTKWVTEVGKTPIGHSFAIPMAPSFVSPPPEPVRKEHEVKEPEVKFLSAWAKEQVTKIATEVREMPRGDRKAAYKRLLLQFHPDKRHAQDNQWASDNRSEAEVSEVFMEVKRRYDAEIAKEQVSKAYPHRRP